jgi:extracellular elastinolytic metalloproteinase
VNPEDLVASPYGWLSVDNKIQATNTSGNNAFSYIAGVPAPQSAPGTFGWNYNTSLNSTASAEQKNAAIVNAFYLVNSVHDVTVSPDP